jgi:predicted metal-dependent hydrolase
MNTSTSQSSTPDEIIIEPRRPEFDFSAAPKVWLRDPFATHFMNALSVLVPYSERTVMDIIRKYAHRISDPKLQREIQALIKQEGRHTFGHHHCNKVLAGCGYSEIPRYERIQQLFVMLLRKIDAGLWELSMPAAFEHFTSAIGKSFIRYRNEWTGGKKNPAVAFTGWHALEELEHQAVCFDVFSAVKKKTWVLSVFLVILWIPATVLSLYGIQFYMLYKDHVLSSKDQWKKYFRFTAWSLPIFFSGALKYLKKDYRPWNKADEMLYKAHKDRTLSSLNN